MRVLLDTNVILDAMLQRAPWHKDADAILQAASDLRRYNYIVSDEFLRWPEGCGHRGSSRRRAAVPYCFRHPADR